jgi:thiol-disulfide isomerase/thioredoxin
MTRVGISLITIALIAGTIGCVGGDGNNGDGSYTLIIDSTAGGTVTVDDVPIPGKAILTYDAGTVVSVSASPDAGYRFAEWTGNVSSIADINAASTTITMNDDYSIMANFLKQYSLTISSTPGGSVTTPGEGTHTYDEGEVVNLVAEAEASHYFVSWTGDVGTIADVEDATTTITMDSHYSITANFVEGDVALDFTLPTMTGANITLSELEGTPVVLNFWSISCPWCRTQLPYLESIAQQSEGQLEVIAISIRDSASEIQTFFGEDEPTMIIALGKNSETFADYCQKYGNSRGAIPFTLFVDGEGIVKYVKFGAFSSEAQLWDTLESVFGIQ